MSAGYGSSGQQVDMGNHWLLRIVAAIIDSIPWGIIIAVILVVLFWSKPDVYNWAPWFGWASWLLLPLLVGILWVLYCTALEASSGITLGKRVLGLKVQMLDGSKVKFSKAFTRNISKIFGPILLIDWIIGIATHGPDPRQRYFDRIAGTTVVSTKEVFAPAPPPPPPPPPP